MAWKEIFLRNKKIIFYLAAFFTLIILFFLILKIINLNKREKIYKNHDILFEELLKNSFETERLIAIKTSNQDIDVLSNFLLDKNITAYLDPTLTDGFKNQIEAKKFLNEDLNDIGKYNFTIKLKNSNNQIGQISFSFSDGILMPSFWVASEYQNKGYASEISMPLTKRIFKYCSDIKTLYISCDYDNLNSTKLSEKICNFVNSDSEYKFSKNEGYTSDEFEGKKIDIEELNFEKNHKTKLYRL